MNGFKVILSWPEKNLYMGHSPNRLEQQPVKLKVPGSSPGCPANSYFSEHTRFVGVVRNRLFAHS